MLYIRRIVIYSGRDFPCEVTLLSSYHLAFVRSGYIGLSDGCLYNVGDNGYGWSQIPGSPVGAYFLIIRTAFVNPSYGSYRWHGFPLRGDTIFQLPLAFVRSGVMGLNDGSIKDLSSHGVYWSYVARAVLNVYPLSVYVTDVLPSGNSYRYVGFPLRLHHIPVTT